MVLILQGGRGNLSIGGCKYHGRNMVVFSRFRGAPKEPGAILAKGEIDLCDAEFAFESDHPGSFRSLEIAARDMADWMEGKERQDRADAILAELKEAGFEEEADTPPIVTQVVEAARSAVRAMHELILLRDSVSQEDFDAALAILEMMMEGED